MQLFLEAVIEKNDKIHARYPGAKRTLCGSELNLRPSGTAEGRVSCDSCKAAWKGAAAKGEFSPEQMEQRS